MDKVVIYIGGYQSEGYKANLLKDNLDCDLIVFEPDYDKELPTDIQRSIVDKIETEISKGNDVQIIGSSTGGMTALLLSEKYILKMYLINPLLAKEQFIDQNHPVGPLLGSISKKLLSLKYKNNSIKIFLGINDELLSPRYTKEFAKSKNIEIITFDGYHAGTESLELIIKYIKNS
ncbi:MAG: hypothetical protein KAH10_03050 [Flavobacteriales bacterium]|nr:hypothetical protein [Flavobacteriales bacterium]